MIYVSGRIRRSSRRSRRAILRFLLRRRDTPEPPGIYKSKPPPPAFFLLFNLLNSSYGISPPLFFNYYFLSPYLLLFDLFLTLESLRITTARLSLPRGKQIEDQFSLVYTHTLAKFSSIEGGGGGGGRIFSAKELKNSNYLRILRGAPGAHSYGTRKKLPPVANFFLYWKSFLFARPRDFIL